MTKDSIEACSGLEVLTHVPDVSAHETQKHSRSRHIWSANNPKLKCQHMRFEESIHIDNSQSKNRSVDTSSERVDTCG